MRFLSMLLVGVLGAGMVFLCAPSSARADSGDVPAPSSASVDASPTIAAQPGTHEEARDYERREEQSPEVQDFAGGDVVIGVSLGLILLVLIIVLLLRD